MRFIGMGECDVDSNDEIRIPRWIAQSLVPTAIVLALGSGLVMWRDVSNLSTRLDYLEPRLAEFEKFRRKGGRFTADDGRKLDTRITRIEQEVRRLADQQRRDHAP